jgi:ABC-2 type transport system ATP-binding protein
MSDFIDSINEVRDYFKNGDYSLGKRRMIDCTLDSSQTALFKRCIDIIEKYDDNDSAIATAPETEDLLSEIAAITVPTKKSDTPLMSVSNISKTYAKGTFKMSPLSFELRYGEVVGLVGENGNGKTTLLRLLARDLKEDQGTLKFKAENETTSLFELRTKLIYIAQRVPKWYGSLMDNLHFTLSMHGIFNEENVMRAELIIARLGLRPYKNLGWNRISSGYRTRFELAKALLRQPELMLLDEPLSNLDIISQQTILQDLKHMSTSVSRPFGIVLSSQQLYEVEKISDMVIFLKQGVAQYQYKHQAQEEDTKQAIIYELETEASREQLLSAFSNCGLETIQYNGGVYVLHFQSETNSKSIFASISSNDLQITYIRNITNSSRRFFIQ